MSVAPVESPRSPQVGKTAHTRRKIPIGLALALLLILIALEVQTLIAEQRTEQTRREIAIAGGKCEIERRVPGWLQVIAGPNMHSFLDRTTIVRVIMSGEEIGDFNVAQIKNVPDLVRLDLEDSQVTSTGLKAVSQLTSLRLLNLNNTEVTDLTALAALTNLETLRLDYCRKVEAEHLTALAQLPQLRALGRGLRLRDDGVAAIALCTRLESLDMAGANLGETGLQPLQKLKQLQLLNLTYATVNPADLGAFKQAVPGCTVAN